MTENEFYEIELACLLIEGNLSTSTPEDIQIFIDKVANDNSLTAKSLLTRLKNIKANLEKEKYKCQEVS